MSIETIRLLKEKAKLPKQKKMYVIPKKSAKKISQERLQMEAGKDSDMDKFFEDMRSKMIGVCQCGCGAKSQKHDDTFYRNCICHIFPKRIFKSIATHPLNWVERTFWGGHHTNMDDRSMELWINFADWDDIVYKFHALSPLLTNEERCKKFYRNLESLVLYGRLRY